VIVFPKMVSKSVLAPFTTIMWSETLMSVTALTVPMTTLVAVVLAANVLTSAICSSKRGESVFRMKLILDGPCSGVLMTAYLSVPMFVRTSNASIASCCANAVTSARSILSFLFDIGQCLICMMSSHLPFLRRPTPSFTKAKSMRLR